MKKLILALAAMLIAMPAQAMTWCPNKANGNSATLAMPTGTVAVLNGRELSVSGVRCDATEDIGDYICASLAHSLWPNPPSELFSVVFTPGTKSIEFGMDEIDYSHPNISKLEMWLLPEYSVATELMFVACGEPPAIM